MEDTGWIKEWYEKQEQLSRLQDIYQNHEMKNELKGKEHGKQYPISR